MSCVFVDPHIKLKNVQAYENLKITILGGEGRFIPNSAFSRFVSCCYDALYHLIVWAQWQNMVI